MTGSAQVTMKTTPENYEDFKRFCARQGISPYAMLKLVVDSWAAAERLVRAAEEGQMAKAEILAELGRLVEKIRIITKANGVFTEAVTQAAKHYGIDLMSPFGAK